MELRRFVTHGKPFPTRTEFDSAGRADLRCAVADLGGSIYWAEQLGMKVTARQRSKEPYPPTQAIEEARRLVESEGYLPGVRALRALGLGRLATEVQRAGGARRFEDLHDLV